MTYFDFFIYCIIAGSTALLFIGIGRFFRRLRNPFRQRSVNDIDGIYRLLEVLEFRQFELLERLDKKRKKKK